MIRFDRVTKRYPDGTTAVDALDLTAPTGQTTVLVGPRLREDDVAADGPADDRADLRVDPPRRSDVADLKAAELRRGIGYVIQHAGLFPHRTIIENIGTVPPCSAGTSAPPGTGAWNCSNGSA